MKELAALLELRQMAQKENRKLMSYALTSAMAERLADEVLNCYHQVDSSWTKEKILEILKSDTFVLFGVPVRVVEG